MPIYEYHCQQCQQTLEVIQKVSDDPLVDCPRCGAASLRKKTSLNAFQLKGSGWFRDGYGTGGADRAGEKTTQTPAKAAGEASKTESVSKPSSAA
jgi:putative FmdB family regulatory protein